MPGNDCPLCIRIHKSNANLVDRMQPVRLVTVESSRSCDTISFAKLCLAESSIACLIKLILCHIPLLETFIFE